MKATFIFAFLILSILLAKHIYALETTISITELLPDAVGSDIGKEYVELYNSAESDINLKDWYFVNTSQTGSSKKIILPEFTIKNGSYFLIAEDNSTLNIANSISIGSGKLALFNDFGKLQLFNASSVLVTEVNYGDSKEGVTWDLDGPICNVLYYSTINTPGVQNSNFKQECFPTQPLPVSFPPKEVVTFDKIEFSLDNNLWTDTLSTFVNIPIYFRYKLSKDVTPTNVVYKDSFGNILSNPHTFLTEYKNAINIEINYLDQIIKGSSLNIDIHNNISTNVLITEVYPSPESPDLEWIEIYNNDKYDINLSNYYIEEKTTSGISNTRKKLNDQTIKSNEYFVLYEDQFNVSLNNSGDTIYLFDLYGNQVNKFIYSETDKSKSVGRKQIDSVFSEETFETLTPTPLSLNIFASSDSVTSSLPTYLLEDLNALTSGTEFYTSVNIDNYIDKYIFISSRSSKLKAKLTKKLDENLANTYVTLKAKVITSNGVKNLLIDPDTIEIINYTEPNYADLDLNSITQTNIGDQVQLTGNIVEVYSNRIKIDINGKIFNVYANEAFGTDLKKGLSITVYGTIDYYRAAFRLIMTNYLTAQVNGDSIQLQNLPASYPLKSNGTLITQDYAKDSSNLYLIILSSIVIVLILGLEIVKNRKFIYKSIKHTFQNNLNIFNKAVIKY